MLPGTPKPGGSSTTSRGGSPNYLGQGNNGTQGGMGMGSTMPQQSEQIPQQQAGALATSTNQTQGKDPFADLVGLF
jgi:hypothetical protein